jgi:hypothetical protein
MIKNLIWRVYKLARRYDKQTGPKEGNVWYFLFIEYLFDFYLASNEIEIIVIHLFYECYLESTS